jgi:hypothetical protein
VGREQQGFSFFGGKPAVFDLLPQDPVESRVKGIDILVLLFALHEWNDEGIARDFRQRLLLNANIHGSESWNTERKM